MTFGPSGTNPDTQGGGDVTSDVTERLRFEALVNDLVAGFVNLEQERVDQAIEDCLRRIAEGLGLDRSTLAQRSGDALIVTHSWAVRSDLHRLPADVEVRLEQNRGRRCGATLDLTAIARARTPGGWRMPS